VRFYGRYERLGGSGFSLIEILVALAIVGLALGTTATVLDTGLLGHGMAVDEDMALAIAEEKLAEAGVTGTLRHGRMEGISNARYRWRVVVSPYEDRQDKKAWASQDVRGPAIGLYRIEVSVGWRENAHDREIAISTLRLGPAWK
jgi:general secretion pathway protein I